MDLVTGEAVRHEVRKRPLLFDLNFMHLNNGKAPWTGIADVYAGLLIVLALTGSFLVQRPQGSGWPRGRDAGSGRALPVVYAVAMRQIG